MYAQRLKRITYFFLFQLEECNTIRQQLDIVLGSLLGGPLFSESVADLHGRAAAHVILVVRIVLLLQIVDIVLHHLHLLLLLLHVHFC